LATALPPVLPWTTSAARYAPEIRARICEPLDFLGFTLDIDANQANATRISAAYSKPVLRIVADEETVIRDLVETALGNQSFSLPV
jgi:acetate kinase